MKTLGKRLRQARDNTGLSQIDAAKKLGISNGTLSGYERDYRDPDTNILHRMAELYDVSVDWLIGKAGKSSESDEDRKNSIINKIIMEFPDAELMFNDLASFTADDMQEVYDFIKFKKSQKGES